MAGTGIGYFFKNFHCTHSGTGIRFKANFCLVYMSGIDLALVLVYTR